MALTSYGPYSVSADIPSGKINVGLLDQQIRLSAIKVALDGVELSGDVLSVTFKDALDAADKTLLDGSALQSPAQPCLPGSILGDHTGEAQPDQQYTDAGNPIVSLEVQQRGGMPLVALGPRVTSEAIYATHNFCDPTTWYAQSVRVVAEAAADAGAGTVWSLAHPNVIDLVQGKVFDEEGIIEDQKIENPGDPHGYAVVVKVDGVEQTMRPPFATDWTQGGDYYVDYEAGQIVFQNSKAGADVRVDYSYATGSLWIMKPLPPIGGQMLAIEKAEVQFSVDIDLSATIVMQVMGPVETFAPDAWDQQSPQFPLLMPQGTTLPVSGEAGNLFYETVTPQLYAHDGTQWQPVPAGPAPSGFLVPLATTLYKSIDQLIDEAVSAYPQIPQFVNTPPPRGYNSAKHIFQFHYASAKLLFPSLGMELHIRLDPDAKLGGERATATFYMTAKDDPGPDAAIHELGLA